MRRILAEPYRARGRSVRRAGFAGLLSLALVTTGGTAIAEGDDAPFVSISKTVTAEFDRTYDWELDKSGELVGTTVGEDDVSADFDYTVTATPAG